MTVQKVVSPMLSESIKLVKLKFGLNGLATYNNASLFIDTINGKFLVQILNKSWSYSKNIFFQFKIRK